MKLHSITKVQLGNLKTEKSSPKCSTHASESKKEGKKKKDLCSKHLKYRDWQHNNNVRKFYHLNDQN